MIWSPDQSVVPSNQHLAVSAFLAFYGVLVLVMGLWARSLALQVSGQTLTRSVARFNKVMSGARMLVPAWLGVGLYVLGWGDVVLQILSPINRWRLDLPGLVLGTLPALLTWAGLWWSQFPADRALREQSLLVQFDQDLPVHSPPGFWSYFFSNLRLQLFFTLVPILLIVGLRDLLFIGLRTFGVNSTTGGWIEAVVSIGAAVLILLFSPELLRRVLRTRPLPDSPLRVRLEALCTRHKVRYREILLWHTDHNMGNAAVMGLMPHVRYVLLSDLLLETMTDDQIEAVFAHELGHVVHRHMGWYVVLMLTLLLVVPGPGQLLHNAVVALGLPVWMPADLVVSVVVTAGFLASFGFLSRRFERQADVFAARTMEAVRSAGARPTVTPVVSASAGGTAVLSIPSLAVESAAMSGEATPARSHVGRYGASLFASALHRVAMINNIPVAARSWCHGSIETRMNYLADLSHDPGATHRFDRLMTRLHVVVLLILGTSALWVALDTIWAMS